MESNLNKYLNIKKIGQNFFTLCLFHKEKTASLLINYKKNFFFCFSCKEKGKLNLILNKIKSLKIKKIKNKIIKKTKNIQIKYNKLKNKNIYIFLKKRKIKKFIAYKFKLTFIKKIFNNRILIPIFKRNKLIAYSGRSIFKKDFPKYINSVNNKSYLRNENFYGLWLTKKYIKKKNFVIIVEGYFDLILLYQFNIKNSLSLMGNNLNLKRLKKLFKLTKNILICLDGDISGLNSIKNILNLILLNNIKFKKIDYLILPFNLDPDSFIKKYKKLNFIKKIYKSKNIFVVYFEIFLLKNKNFKNFIKLIDVTSFSVKKIINYFIKNFKFKLKFFIFIFSNSNYKLINKNFITFICFLESLIFNYFILFPFIIYKINKLFLKKLFLLINNKKIFLNILKIINKIKKKNFLNFFLNIRNLKVNNPYISILLRINKNIKLYYIFNIKLNKYLKNKKIEYIKKLKAKLINFIKDSIKYLIYIKNEKKFNKKNS